MNLVTPRSITPQASTMLDACRAIAAILVMLGHARALMFVDYAQVERKGALIKAFYFVTGLGHASVMVFFVLSGFLIGSAVIGRVTSGRWNPADYAAARLSRLWVVLIPALVAGLLLDLVGTVLAPGLYEGRWETSSIVGGNIGNHLTLPTFFVNLLFLQGIAGTTFGSNGPLWSLSYEFWYYVMFPLGFLALCGSGALRWRLVAGGLVALLAGVLLPLPITLYFLIWLLGVAIAIAPVGGRMMSRLLGCGGAAALLASLLMIRGGMLESATFFSDLCVGIAFSTLVYGMLGSGAAPGQRTPGVFARASKWLADFSYSLYLLHLPLLLLLRASWVGEQRWQPGAVSLGCWLLACLLALVYAWLLSLVTERKTLVVRDWLRRAFGLPTAFRVR